MLTRLDARRAPQAPSGGWELDQPLLRWDGESSWTIGDACMGTAIFGSTGSGKSTGSLATIVRSFLRAGFGGLFLTAKREDSATYQRYVHAEGRDRDLMVFSPDHLLRYNFIQAELQERDGHVGVTETLTALLLTVTELLDRGQPGGARENEGYFKKMAARLARNAIQALVLGCGRVTIPELHQFITSTADSREMVLSKEWQTGSFCYQVMAAAEKAPKTEAQKKDYDLVVPFFMWEWPGMSARSRASVETTLTAATDLLSRGAARDLLSSPTTNVSPAMCHDGAIVIADFPVLLYHDIGQLIQVILKFCWQRANGRRDLSRSPRPTFIVADESHLLAVNADQSFQTTARSSRTAVVYATQSISNYLEVFGPESEPRVHSLLGNLQTQVWHQQTDTRTISYIQELIGRSPRLFVNGNSSRDADDWLASLAGLGNETRSTGFTESLEHELQAGDLNSLARGGPPDWSVEGIVYAAGRRFPQNGRTWLPVRFRQDV